MLDIYRIVVTGIGEVTANAFLFSNAWRFFEGICSGVQYALYEHVDNQKSVRLRLPSQTGSPPRRPVRPGQTAVASAHGIAGFAELDYAQRAFKALALS
jgi:hypothetical protein